MRSLDCKVALLSILAKKAMRYIVTIDLTDSTFHPDSKKHNRVLWALKEKKPLEFDFLLAWYNTVAILVNQNWHIG